MGGSGSVDAHGPGQVRTEILPVGPFYPAEPRHQQFLEPLGQVSAHTHTHTHRPRPMARAGPGAAGQRRCVAAERVDGGVTSGGGPAVGGQGVLGAGAHGRVRVAGVRGAPPAGPPAQLARCSDQCAARCNAAAGGRLAHTERLC